MGIPNGTPMNKFQDSNMLHFSIQEHPFGTQDVFECIKNNLASSDLSIMEGWNLQNWECDNTGRNVVKKCTFINRQRDTFELEPDVLIIFLIFFYKTI